jgi:predicted DNA-binding transcriptional regulator YafY
MSKRESINRYNLIIKLLKKRPSSFEEISRFLEQESEIQSCDFSISKRTFQRDLADIRSIYNIEIAFDYTRKVYHLVSDQSPEHNDRLFEAFDTFNALNIRERLADFLHLEKRQPQGTENLYGLLHAIRNRLQIKFIHHKFWEDKPTVRTLNPYALKEFRNRWYVMGLDLGDKQIKSFALDRLSDLDIIKNIKFSVPVDFDMQEHFRYCFGIISPNNNKPEEIVLSFTPLQGKYIKTLPLHETQEIILDNKHELRIKLRLFITHDLLMEILSFGDGVQVISPPQLVEEIVSTYKSAARQYKNKKTFRLGA